MATAAALATLPAEQVEAFFASLSPVEAVALEHDWAFWARPEQRDPLGDWLVWVIQAGRGFGKTRTGAECTNTQAKQHPGCRIALVGKEPDDYRDTMIQGEAGLLACSPPWFRPVFNPSLRKVTWPNGSQALCYSGETPDDLRGPAHHFAWVDEFCKFKHPKKVWDNLMLGLRLGDRPRAVVTTTPRPILAFLSILYSDIRQRLRRPHVAVTGGSTYANLANLAGPFREQVLSQYEGTRLGRQELYAELLMDVPGALWKRERLDVQRVDAAPSFVRVAIGVDPATTSGEESNETGICVGGRDEKRHGYLIEDCSGHYTPGQWGEKVVRKFLEHGANEVIAESNQGGEMVQYTIQTAARQVGLELGREVIVPVRLVHASHGKVARAEPIAALDEQGRLHHVGTWGSLEDQLCLAPWTLIITERGNISLDTVRAGDKVLTRAGWKDVEWAGPTSFSSILHIGFSNGVTLDATSRHPIATADGFRPASSLTIGQEVLICQCQLCDPTSNLKESNSFLARRNRSRVITEHREAAPATHSFSITQYGNRYIDRFLKATNFITETETNSTMPLRTFSWSHGVNTSSFMARQVRSLNRQMSAVLSARQNGRRNPSTSGAVESVELRSYHGPHSLHSAHVDVGIATVQSISILPGRYLAYNLQVSECPEFIANGILTHNCTWLPGEKSPDRLDAYVWLFWGLILEGQVALEFYGGQVERVKTDEEQAVLRKVAAQEVEEAIKAQGFYWPGGR